MTQVVWDDTGNRKYETGVDHGVLYPLNASTSLYDAGFAWNGLTAVNEKPGGAASNPQYADNIKYLDLRSAETFAGTLEAFTYPDEFGACDGTAAPVAGLVVGQQTRQSFGLCYRTKVGNDVSGDLGYKIHLVYGATAAPSEKDFATINDSPAAVQFSWDFDCSPVSVSGMQPTALIVLDSSKVDSAALADLEELLYGTVGTDPSLPSPDDVIALFSGTVTAVAPTAPTFASNVITIPSTAGVIYSIAGVDVEAGAQPAITADTVVNARPAAGYVFSEPSVDEWYFVHS
jgi:hypothetical protein